MNLELLESFGQNYPEEGDGTLDCISMALTCAFNKRGTLLAVGCNDGRIVIWDFLTRGIAKLLTAHVHPVCSLSWNRSGHRLLSASTDNMVAVWDILTGECEQRYRLPSPVLKVQFNPRNDKQIMVCPMKQPPVLISSDGQYSVLPVVDESDMNIVASFDRRGLYIYMGNAKGKIGVIETKSLELVASFRVTTGASNTTAIKSIEFARRGNCFLVNTADRIIRVYESGEVLACGKEGEPEPIQKLQDLVNRTPWKKCCFSGDGEYICAGSARQHALYVWEKSIGNLVKILHGTRGELLLDVVWHPVRPILASVSSGVVSVWAQNQVENWSAFAPDFKELDENVEYEEKESEFDIEDEDKSVEDPVDTQALEDVEVDVTTVGKISAFISSDEEEEDEAALLYLPVAPDIEEPDESPWQQTIDPTDEVSISNQNKRPAMLPEGASVSPKKKKFKTIDIDIEGAPTNEIHPLLNPKGERNPKPKKVPSIRQSKVGSKHLRDSSGKSKKSRSKDSSLKTLSPADPYLLDDVGSDKVNP